MDSQTKVVKYAIDFTENASYSLVNEDFENVSTAVIKDGNITVYFKDGTKPQEFGARISDFMNYIEDENLMFIKLTSDKHWKEYNPNPKGKNIGDCTLRAYCAAFDISWEEAFDIASGIAKENASMIQYVAEKVLLEHFNCTVSDEYNKKTVKAKDRITVAEYAETHPYGTYILKIRNHVVTLKDGEYWDSWDSGSKKLDVVYNVAK